MRTGVDSSGQGDGEPEEIGVWLAAGFNRDEAEIWRRWRYSLAQAKTWKAAGIDDGLLAAQWSTAGATPTTVQGWRDAGIDATEAVRWHEFGFGLDFARSERQQGHGPEEVFARTHGAGRATPPGAVPRGLVAYGPGGGPGRAGPLRRFVDAGVDPRTAHSYLEHRWIDDAAVTWAAHGVEAQDAYTWHELGLTASEAGRLTLQGRTIGDVVREWWSAGIPIDEVADWIGAGLSATEALEQRARGITIEQAAALRALRQDELPSRNAPSASATRLSRSGPPESERAGPPPSDEEGARVGIVAAFGAMFTQDEATNGVASVDGGANLGGCLEEVSRSGRMMTDLSSAVVKVNLVQFVNDHYARVSFSVSIAAPGSPPWGDERGRAALLGGTWKVTRETFCWLMQALGIACPPR